MKLNRFFCICEQSKKQPNILSLGRMYSSINETNYQNQIF